MGRKERSLRILGKHLSSVQSERKQQEERLQRAEDELRDMKASGTSDKKVNAQTHTQTHKHTNTLTYSQPLIIISLWPCFR